MPGFSSPPNPSAFNARVWEIVRRIPAGKVLAYGQVGALVPVPDGMSLKDYDAFRARWVGGAMAACPEGVPKSARARGPKNSAPCLKPRALLSMKKAALIWRALAGILELFISSRAAGRNPAHSGKDFYPTGAMSPGLNTAEKRRLLDPLKQTVSWLKIKD